MKQLIWVTIAMIFSVLPAQADDTKLVGRWRAEYALTAKDKPHVAWELELQKGGTFRMTEMALNTPGKLKNNRRNWKPGAGGLSSLRSRKN